MTETCYHYSMKWIAIAGAWRKTNLEIEKMIRKTVKNIIKKGEGVVSGGALGVDSLALDEALRNNPSATQIKILIPSSLETYATHYRNRAQEGVITAKQAEELIKQLTTLKDINSQALIEGENRVLNKESYFDRITKIIDVSDELIAFHVNQSEGTQDTITKAQKKGIPVKVFSYTLE